MPDRQTAVATRQPLPPRTTARRRKRGGMWRRGWFIAVLALLAAMVLMFHRGVPNSVGNLGSLLDTFLPWVGVAVPVLGVAALVRRSATAGVALLLPTLIWGLMFGHLLLPGRAAGGAYDLRVLSHNVDAANPDPKQTAQELLAADADVVALEELTPADLKIYKSEFAKTYPYQVSRDTVALWSKFPVDETKSVDVGFTWTRALRADVETPKGTVAVYVAHLASVRVGTSGFTSDQRNETIKALGRQIAAEKEQHVIVMGDFNGTVNDRSLAPLTSGLRSAQGAAGTGFGFTWPAAFPMARIDHILVRGLTPTKAWVMSSTGSDHRPVIAELRV
ncbi:endonuclease/exonuclease/phosphatase family protein [Kribbella solani]|uniref:endonuclease/exonuclease/phosphatase family protein n=1 Tax=Kribbella solani TaxID=236067 RepID=UPI0029B31809|nr:endonuclease/exonuclease/phosphatase family protein [Kribbella solani]MDX2968661.1 endonuclease/exonuclease/phosphatase family protein [Kribbella solani]MDX3006663.1 endonuclease/exonuclease/phosphatase family protein [Kribbella solani]